MLFEYFPPTERDWIDVLQALLTPLIAVIAAYVAWRQWRTNQNKLKLDLFDRRWSVYEATISVVNNLAAMAYEPDDRQMVVELEAKTEEARWLFSHEVADYLRQELVSNAYKLFQVQREWEAATEFEKPSIAARSDEVHAWFEQQRKKVETLFGPYLQLSH